jgi:hypothetical protein
MKKQFYCPKCYAVLHKVVQYSICIKCEDSKLFPPLSWEEFTSALCDTATLAVKVSRQSPGKQAIYELAGQVGLWWISRNVTLSNWPLADEIYASFGHYVRVMRQANVREVKSLEKIVPIRPQITIRADGQSYILTRALLRAAYIRFRKYHSNLHQTPNRFKLQKAYAQLTLFPPVTRLKG